MRNLTCPLLFLYSIVKRASATLVTARSFHSSLAKSLNMSLLILNIRGIFLLLVFLFLFFPSTQGQGPTVTIEQLPAYGSQPIDVQECLWEPGHKDVASTVGCPMPVLNACYCPTGIVQQAAILSAITGCMTYWYSATGGIDVAAATSVYSQYCQNAVSATSQCSSCT